MLEDQDPFKKILLKQERCFFSLEHVESSKLGPLGTKSGALDSIVQAPILAPPLRCIIWGKLINFKPPFFLLQNGSNGGTQLISLCRLGVVIEIKCLADTKRSQVLAITDNTFDLIITDDHDSLPIFPTSRFIKGSKYNCSGAAQMEHTWQNECSQATLSLLAALVPPRTLLTAIRALRRDTIKPVAGN